MIEYKEEKVTEVKKVILSKVCNKCGEPIEKISDAPYSSFVDHCVITQSWGYLSLHFLQNEFHKFDICEGCYAEWISTFKIAPTGFGRCGYYDEDINEQEEFERWKIKRNFYFKNNINNN